MSWQASTWADGLEYDACGALAFRVLSKLANAADAEGKSAYRANNRLANELGVSQRSIQRALRELEHARIIIPGDQRILAYIRKDRRPTVYDLNMVPHIGFQNLELDGVTELSTAIDGVTTGVADGVTTGVAKNSPLNHPPIKSSRDNHTADVTPSPVERCILGGEHHRVGGECVKCGLEEGRYWLPDGTTAEVPA